MRRSDLELSTEEAYALVDANKFAVVSLIDAPIELIYDTDHKERL